MADGSPIQWTEATWNPTTGCDRVSAGCDNCYALTLAKRLKAMGSAHYQTDGDPATSGPGFGIAMHEDALTIPLRWRKPRTVFVNSMSDLFHSEVSGEFIAKVFAVMAATPQHKYQILSKRHARMRSLLSSGEFVARVRRAYCGGFAWPLPNVWLGVSVETQEWAQRRIPALLQTPATVRFISAEPLLGPLDLENLEARNGALIDALGGDVKTPRGEVYSGTPSVLDWVIIGGESGPGAQPMAVTWVRSLLEQCRDRSARPFVKQLGSDWARFVRAADHKGGDPAEWPEDLRVRQMPSAVGAVSA